MRTADTVTSKKQNSMIPGTGWSLQDALEETAEARRESRSHGSDLDRILSRYGEELASDREPIGLDEALEHRREQRALTRLHRSPVQRALHHLGECRCHQQ